MSTTTNTRSGGIGFIGLLTILFIGLKLTGHITWSWWWVLSPIWGIIPAILLLIGGGALIIGSLIFLWVAFSSLWKRKR